MKLYEFEGKQFLTQAGLEVPRQYGFFTLASDIPDDVPLPAVIKVQILQGKRGIRGGVKVVATPQEKSDFSESIFNQQFDGEKPVGVLIEQAIEAGVDLYISISYANSRPVVVINTAGGGAVEDSAKHSVTLTIDPMTKQVAGNIEDAVKNLGLPVEAVSSLKLVIQKSIGLFFDHDCTLLEINPLRYVADTWLALDCKLVFDDRALYRHTDRVVVSTQFPSGRQLTGREQAVKAINEHPEYKGSPCRYVELDGDVALLLSGGGASLIIFDALVASGIKPGNYSEYSGNPKKEKVEALTRVVLSKPGQRGLFIGGGIANFTLIDETMRGVADALAELKPAYPIVIRRGGPNEDIAREMMQELAKTHQLDITWLGSETSLQAACEFFVKKMNHYV